LDRSESPRLSKTATVVFLDPVDRMLVAQAIVHGMTILTPDLEIDQYAVRVLW
jgi:PIN domain nuclease of toxin-antitoxin system